MELTALALFLTTTSHAQQLLPAFTTVDGQPIAHAEGQTALQQGHAVLVGDLLVGAYSLPAAA